MKLMLSELLLKKFPALLELLLQVPFPNIIFSFLVTPLWVGWFDFPYVVYMEIQIYKVGILQFLGIAVGGYKDPGLNSCWFWSVLGILFPLSFIPSSLLFLCLFCIESEFCIALSLLRMLLYRGYQTDKSDTPFFVFNYAKPHTILCQDEL